MVYLFLAEGFEEIEALTPVDLLRRAGINVVTVGIGARCVCGAHGIKVNADMTEDEALALYKNDMEAVILPGGMPGSRNLDESKTVDAFLAFAKENNIPYAAICAAPMVLGKRGMLRGKRAVCYPGFEEFLLGAEVVDCGAVRDGSCVCGRAMGSAAEFALLIIEMLKGKDKAHEIKKAIIL